MSPKGGGRQSDRRTRANDSAARKIEQKEAEREAKTGKPAKPPAGFGRVVRDGWVKGAKR